MKNHEGKYKIIIYNRFMSLHSEPQCSLEDFQIEDFIDSPYPELGDLSLIEITKKVKKKDYETEKPILILYNKNLWQIKSHIIKERFHYKFMLHTTYSCAHHTLNFRNKFPLYIPCNSENELTNRLDAIISLLTNKEKTNNQILLKK